MVFTKYIMLNRGAKKTSSIRTKFKTPPSEDTGQHNNPRIFGILGSKPTPQMGGWSQKKQPSTLKEMC